jgi:hypothetical protein
MLEPQKLSSKIKLEKILKQEILSRESTVVKFSEVEIKLF